MAHRKQSHGPLKKLALRDLISENAEFPMFVIKLCKNAEA